MSIHLQLLHPESAQDRYRCAELYLHSPRFALRLRHQLTSAERGMQALMETPADLPPASVLNVGIFCRDDMVGFAKIYVGFPDPSRATIGLLLIDERHQRRHLGTQALEALSRKARQWPDVHQWTLHARDDDPAALSFWRACGFDTLTPGCVLPTFPGTFSLMERAVKFKSRGSRDGAGKRSGAVPDHPFRRFISP